MPRKYSGILRTLCNPSIFRTLAYSEPWHIQNRGIFRTLGYLELGANLEPRQTSTMEHCAKVVNSYSCFRKLQLFLQYQLFKFSFLKNLIKVCFLLQKCLFYVKKHSDPEGRGPWILIYPHCCNFLFIINSLIKFI